MSKLDDLKKEVRSSLGPLGVLDQEPLHEVATILMPKPVLIQTDSTSKTTKEIHERVYNDLVRSYNTISARLDSLPKDKDNDTDSEARRLMTDLMNCANGVKLHELYFANIGDSQSSIASDSIAFMKFSRDWGTFEQWQFDLRSCFLTSREGWAITYYDPMKRRYYNTFIEGNHLHIPVMCIPVVVLDTHHHAWFKDYPGEKLVFFNTMMQELVWPIVEARMVICETSNLDKIYSFVPSYSAPEKSSLPSSAAPVQPLKPDGGVIEDEEV
jgi:Fe-Mn family superoxide dismutase